MKIEIDPNHYLDIQAMLSSISVGGISPTYVEEQVNELSEFIPLLPMILAWMAVSINRTHEAKERDIEGDRSALREFLLQNEMLCRSQGALAALLCVAEVLKPMFKESVEKSSPETDELGRTSDDDSKD